MVLRSQRFLVQLSTAFRTSSLSLVQRQNWHTTLRFRSSCLHGRLLSNIAVPHRSLHGSTETWPLEASLSSNVAEDCLDGRGGIAQEDVASATESFKDAQSEDVERDDIEDYLQGRQGHPSFLKKLRPVIFIRLTRLAMKQHLYGVVNTIASDVVSVAKLQAEDVQRLSTRNISIPAKDYARTACILLQFSCFLPAHSDANVIDLCKLVLERPTEAHSTSSNLEDQTTNNLPYDFTLNSLSRVLRAVIRRLNGGTIDRQKNFVQALIMAVSERIGSEIDGPVDKNFAALQSAPSKSMDTAALSRITRMLFRFIQFILEGGDDSHWVLAYGAFEVIVKHDLMPSVAIREEDKETKHVPTMILSPIIRTCLVHGWTFDAVDLLQSMHVSDSRLKAHFEALAEDVVCALLEPCVVKRVKRGAELIQSTFDRVPDFAFDSECMQKFYDAACSCGLRETVAALYLHLRSQYPNQSAALLPKGPALLWLLDTFVKRHPNQHGAKLLAAHILETRPRIAKHTVPNIIALCAEARLVEESQQLWGYYAQGVDKVMVTGNPRLMVSLVKLFANEGKREKTKRRVGEGKSTDVASGYVSEGFQGADSAAEFALPSSRAQTGEQRSQGGSEAHAIQSEQTLFGRRNADEAYPPDSIADPHIGPQEESAISTQLPSVDNNTNSSIEQPKSFSEGREDYPESLTMERAEIIFARRVLEEFEVAKKPLTRASHLDLNAIARGRALVGDFQESMNALRIVIDRKEVPDVFDINIVVEALAVHDPARAALVVKTMLEMNVMPDNVTFGTLINHALNHGDLALAGRCYAQSRSLGIKELTPSTIARLVQASLKAALGMVGGRSVRVSERIALEYVQRAYDVFASGQFPRKMFSTEVGEQGVKAALRARSGELAFKFWDTLMRGRVDDDSPEHVKLRRHIAARVRKDCERGALEWFIGHKYIDDLGGGDHKSAEVREHEQAFTLLQEPGR